MALIFILLFALNFVAYSQINPTKADFLIIEKTDHLIIYNKYQHRINDKERELFKSFVPLRITEKNILLHDNYTLGIKVELNGKFFYILKQDTETIYNESKLGFVKYFKDVDALMDTIQLISESKILSKPEDPKTRIALGRNEKLFRIFKTEEHIYVKTLNDDSVYGWLDANKNFEYSIIRWERKANIDKSIGNTILLSRLQKKIDEMNRVLEEIYKYFNNKSRVQREIPKWNYYLEEGSVTYIFEPSYYVKHYPNSIQRMAANLIDVASNSNLSIYYSHGKIVIKRQTD